VLIALMFVLWGGWTLTQRTDHRFNRLAATLLTLGTVLALAAFLLPGLPLLAGGTEAFRDFTPTEFSWPLFSLGYALMLAGLLRVLK
jgi:hypothetical protein